MDLLGLLQELINGIVGLLNGLLGMLEQLLRPILDLVDRWNNLFGE